MFKRKCSYIATWLFTLPKWFPKAELREDFYVKLSTLSDHYIPIYWGRAGEYNSDERPGHFSCRAIAKNRNKTFSGNCTAAVDYLGVAIHARSCFWLWCLSPSCRVPAGLESHFVLNRRKTRSLITCMSPIDMEDTQETEQLPQIGHAITLNAIFH